MSLFSYLIGYQLSTQLDILCIYVICSLAVITFYILYTLHILQLWLLLSVTRSMRIPHPQMNQHIFHHLVLLFMKQCQEETRMPCG
jgi:hypothetical protein